MNFLQRDVYGRTILLKKFCFAEESLEVFSGTEEILALRHDEVLRAQRRNMSAVEIVDGGNRQDLFMALGPDTPALSPESRRMIARFQAAFDLALEQARITLRIYQPLSLNRVDFY